MIRGRRNMRPHRPRSWVSALSAPIAARAESSKAVDITRRRVVIIGGRLGLTMTHHEMSVRRPSPRVRFQGQWTHAVLCKLSKIVGRRGLVTCPGGGRLWVMSSSPIYFFSRLSVNNLLDIRAVIKSLLLIITILVISYCLYYIIAHYKHSLHRL